MQETRNARKFKSVNSDLTVFFFFFLIMGEEKEKKYINNFLTISIEVVSYGLLYHRIFVFDKT